MQEIGLALTIASTSERVYISAGPANTGFTQLSVNGNDMSVGESSVTIVYTSTHEATLMAGPYTIVIENVDGFVNFRSVSVSAESWTRLQSHGLLGQTWRHQVYGGKVPYIQGEVDDYVVAEDDVFGVSFPYNRYQQDLQ